MAQKKKGFISRMIEGPERSDSYARSTLPGNRWELGWDVFRNNLGKMVGINMLMLLFMLPLFIILFLRYTNIQYYALMMPFSQNIGVGYPAVPMYPGIVEQIHLTANQSTLIYIPIAGAVASVGISGGMYVMRNMVWSEGVFVGTDFWTGVKKNFLVVFLSTTLYSVLLLMSIFSISYANYITATGNGTWWLTLATILSYVMLAFFTIVYLYMLSFGVTYELKFKGLLKNSAIMAIALVPTNLFFAAFAFITIILMLLGNIFISLGLIAFILFGLSGALLIWTNYTQWTFDKFVNDKVPGAIKNRGIYNKNASDDETADFSFERSTLGKRPIKPITDYDVEIIEIPETFSRADLRRLEESKAAMRKASDDYVNDVLSGKINEKTLPDLKVDESEADEDEIDASTNSTEDK
ncbi:MAG: hypothetical protein IKJ19_03985 [Clostridia bacterium]|nr:hypothetical protein [Clostridia bacterium]